MADREDFFERSPDIEVSAVVKMAPEYLANMLAELERDDVWYDPGQLTTQRLKEGIYFQRDTSLGVTVRSLARVSKERISDREYTVTIIGKVYIVDDLTIDMYTQRYHIIAGGKPNTSVVTMRTYFEGLIKNPIIRSLAVRLYTPKMDAAIKRLEALLNTEQ